MERVAARDPLHHARVLRERHHGVALDVELEAVRVRVGLLYTFTYIGVS